MKFAAPLLVLASLTRFAQGAIELSDLATADTDATTFTGIADDDNTIRISYTDDNAGFDDTEGPLFVTASFSTGAACATTIDLTTGIPPFQSESRTYTDGDGTGFITFTVKNHLTKNWVVGAEQKLCMDVALKLKGRDAAGALDVTNDDTIYTRRYTYDITVTANGGTTYSSASTDADIVTTAGTVFNQAGVGAASDEKPTIVTTITSTPAGAAYSFGEAIALGVTYTASADNVFMNYLITEVKPYKTYVATDPAPTVTSFETAGNVAIPFSVSPTVTDSGTGIKTKTQTATITNVQVPLSIYQRNPTSIFIGFRVDYSKAVRRLSAEGTIRGLQESGSEASSAEAPLASLTKADLEGVTEEEMKEAGINPADYGIEFSAGVAAQAGVVAMAALVAGVALVF